MDFAKRNIGKTNRNGAAQSSAKTLAGGGSIPSHVSLNFLPAISNGDGTYTVSLDKVFFSGSVIAEKELSAHGMGEEGEGSGYILPPATSTTLGGIMVGDGLSMDTNGKLSVVGGGGSSFPELPDKINSFVAKGSGWVLLSSELTNLRYATQTWVTQQGYLTEHQSLADYATQQWVTQQGYLTEHQSLADYATQQWVTQQGYLTEHQSLADYATITYVDGKVNPIQKITDKFYIDKNGNIHSSVSFISDFELTAYGKGDDGEVKVVTLDTAQTITGRKTFNDITYASHIYPNGSNTYNLGTKDNYWRNVYTHWVAGGTGQSLILGANNDESIFIDTSQRVGINKSDPATVLHVFGDVYSDVRNSLSRTHGAAYMWNKDGTHYAGLGASGTLTKIGLVSSLSSGTWAEASGNEDFAISGFRYVGIGTDSPTTGLEVAGGFKSDKIFIGNSNEINCDYRLFLNYANANNVILVHGGGNVGINKDEPTEKLDVNGNILASGTITQGSDVRFKKNIRNLTNRGFVTPKSFTKDGENQIGFVAQDMQVLYPELVRDDKSKNHYLSVNYSQFTAVLEAQIIDQHREIDELKKMIVELKGIIENGTR